METSHKHKRAGFTLVELLVVIAIIGILIAMLLPAVQQVREAARRTACANQMRQMTLAMMNYESAHQHFPSGNITGEGSFADTRLEAGLNWNVIILPFAELQAQFDDVNEVTDDLTNPEAALNTVAIVENVFPIFVCPSCPMEEINVSRPGPDQAKSNYVAIWGIQTNGNSDWDDIAEAAGKPVDVYDETLYSGILFINSEVSFGEITDGSSNTLIIGERDGAPIGDTGEIRRAATWCASGSAQWSNQCMAPISPEPDYTINTAAFNGPARWNAISSQHPGGVTFGRADGSVDFVTETIDGNVYEALGTKNGGEIDRLN